MPSVTIALAGNPNAGKSTIFNALTGAHQHVGNWPGKTVERKAGLFRHAGQTFELVDLPGAYSLAAFSPEEQIARAFLIMGGPTAVITVVDAANLERNLYLTAQVLETGVPVILALNMMDVAQRRGLRIDIDQLAARLGIPVIPVVASRGQGLPELKQAIVSCAARAAVATPRPTPLPVPRATGCH